MPCVHFLNVSSGDCCILQHGSGRVSVLDICCGNREEEKLADILDEARVRGNFCMCEKPTNPITYLRKIGESNVFRFILTHPDMDHLDGFKALCDGIGIANFWDSGVRKVKPDFAQGRYLEKDWQEYEAVRDGKRQVRVVTPQAGTAFQFANRNEDGTDGGDCLSIVSPNQALIDEANREWDDVNDASYVIAYRTVGGTIVFPGDAHDQTWEQVTTNYLSQVQNCSVLIAPHHGRSSGRSYDFLDQLKPKLVLFGCAPSEDQFHEAVGRRGIDLITNNQAGNIVLNAHNEGIDVFVENETFAKKWRLFDATKQLYGSYFIGCIGRPSPT